MSSVTQSFASASAGSGWINPNNALTDDADYSVSPLTIGNTANGYWEGLNPFGANPLPPTARIGSIVISIVGKSSVTGASLNFRAQDATLRKGGVQYPGSNTNFSAVFTSTTDQTRDLPNIWGLTGLVGDDLNDITFGVRIPFFNARGTAQTFSLKHVRITVVYTDASGSNHHQFFWNEL